jgi:exodeoxyribonuclease VII small subunit
MTDKPDYRALSAELDELLTKLQSGELTIDEAVPAYERGLKLVKELETYLKTAENTVKKLTPKRPE